MEIHLKDLKIIQIHIQRTLSNNENTTKELNFDFDNLEELKIPRYNGEGSHPIFERSGIVVNQRELSPESSSSKHNSRSRRRYSRNRSRSREISKRHRSRSRSSRRDSERRHRSPSYESRRHDRRSVGRSERRSRNRSRSPHYSQSSSRRRSRSPRRSDTATLPLPLIISPDLNYYRREDAIWYPAPVILPPNIMPPRGMFRTPGNRMPYSGRFPCMPPMQNQYRPINRPP